MKKTVIINWHDIKPEDEPKDMRAPFVHGRLTPREFSRQIGSLTEYFTPIALSKYLDFCDGHGDIHERSCIVTFDDGLKSCLREAVPVLKHFGIRAAFFICPGTYETRALLAVHMVNMLVRECGLEHFADEFYRTQKDLYGGDVPRRKPEKYGIGNPYYRDNNRYGTVKYDINYALPIEVRDVVLDRVFHKIIGDPKHVSDTLYLDPDEVRTLAKEGHDIGSHGYRHHVMSMLPRDTQRDEASRSLQSLQKLLPDRSFAFAYPQGVPGSYSNETRECLRESGYRAALVVDNATLNGAPEDRYTLSRYDMAMAFQPDGSLIPALHT